MPEQTHYVAKTLQDGEAIVVDCRRVVRLSVITGAGATATVSRVDSGGATAHTTGASNQFTVGASSRTTTDVDWPFYRVSVAGGSCRVGTV
jgi:hypothetical protein